MKKIYKQVVPICGNTIMIHGTGATMPNIVHVALQEGIPTVWFEIDPNFPYINSTNVRWFGTGHDIPDNARYLGTIQQHGYVWHLYQI